ncbi:MAG: CinA family protein [Candidatus Thermoplasmatota archaeon]|nr:CinA family protein [Candidatus Thermoplasmatota archaeon]
MSDRQLLSLISRKLTEKNLRIATAESCSGGLIAHSLTNISGSSSYFDRGVVSYSNRSKQELLGVPEILLQTYGAVSEQVAKAMAEGIRARAEVDIGVASTGIAGPTGGSKEKPVGLVYIGVSTGSKTMVNRFIFQGTRLSIKKQTCRAGLMMILEVLD